ncbi:hypothetical protein RIF29_35544 [Crotalaria pallida]|uniref:CLAVATA3/ESR (CLE)-related protein 9 n=1 Tax=Crotalaria pallida TaxID=3830 RepID=A0AAN9EA22_CROPI
MRLLQLALIAYVITLPSFCHHSMHDLSLNYTQDYTNHIHFTLLPFSVSLMKGSLSSASPYASGNILITLLVLLFLFFVSSANCRLPSPLLPSSTSSRNNHNNQQQQQQQRYCDSFSKRRNSHSLCMELQRIHHNNLHPFPQLAPKANKVDPRYVAEKRRVPSGPNPLHN